MSIARWKPSREVSSKAPPRSSRLAKATEWMRMSIGAEVLLGFRHDGCDRVVDGDVARLDEVAADGGGEGLDAALEDLAGVAEAERRAFAVKGLGDAPGDASGRWRRRR